MTLQGRMKPLLWIPRFVLVVSVLAILFIRPLCYCPRYYIALSVAGIIPLVCGPRLYRWLASAYIVAALLLAVSEHRAALDQADQIQRLRAEVGHSIREIST